jgi:hypothetical protein
MGSAQQGDQERHTSAGAARERRTSGSAGAQREEVRRCREELGTYLTRRSSSWSELGTDLVRAERPGAAHGRGTAARSRARADLRGGRLESRRQSRRDQEGRGATSQELDPGTRRGGAGRSRGGRAQETEGERGAQEKDGRRKTEGDKNTAQWPRNIMRAYVPQPPMYISSSEIWPDGGI